MARIVRDSSLETRAARARLKVRGKPYYRALEPGLHLGYRRLKGVAGTWVSRRYTGKRIYQVERIGTADDFSDADGTAILSYAQAQKAARKKMVVAPVPADAPTVRQAVETYIATRDTRDSKRRGREVRSDAHTRLTRYVLAAPLADVALQALVDESDLIAWRQGLPDGLKATTKQRLINDVKAALNAACTTHRKQVDPMLPAVIRSALKAEPYSGEEPEQVARDNQILADADIGRLIRAAREIDAEEDWGGDLYRMVVALAATGARFGQVRRMHVGDFQRPQRRLMVPVSRKGKGKSGSTAVAVGQDVLDALQPAVTGRPSPAALLERWYHSQVASDKKGRWRWERTERKPWQSASELTRPWAAIRKRAGLPEVIPYALRHSSIVRGIRANLPIRLVAALHDTSVAMIERHYGKYIVDGLEKLAADAVVPLVPSDGAVVHLKPAKAKVGAGR